MSKKAWAGLGWSQQLEIPLHLDNTCGWPWLQHLGQHLLPLGTLQQKGELEARQSGLKLALQYGMSAKQCLKPLCHNAQIYSKYTQLLPSQITF